MSRTLRMEAFILSLTVFLFPHLQAGGQSADRLAEDCKILQAANLPVDGPGLLRVFRQFVPAENEQERLEGWVGQLGDDNFRVRDQATRALIDAGPMAVAVLTEALASKNLERSRRASKCIREIEAASWPAITASAARLIGHHRPAGASEALIDFLPYVGDAAVVEEIYEVLTELGLSDDETRQTLAQALTSSLPVQRAAAALVLGRWGDAGQRSVVRQLFDDASVEVRLRAAQGLLSSGDTGAVEVLVGLLLSETAIARRAEDSLSQIAGHGGPDILLGDDRKLRQQTHAAWQDWWRAHRDGIDLAQAVAEANGSPLGRASQVSRQLLLALVTGDFPAFKQLVDVPFNVSDARLDNWPELEKFYGQISDEFRRNKAQVAFRMTQIVSVDEYLRTARESTQALRNQPPENIRVVYIRGHFGGAREESGAIFVRTDGASPRVIGIGPGEPIAESAAK